MSEDKVIELKRKRSIMELFQNEYEDDNIESVSIALTNAEGQCIVLTTENKPDLDAASFFAEYFERERKKIVEEMFEDATEQYA
jgi:hypothetical protein